MFSAIKSKLLRFEQLLSLVEAAQSLYQWPTAQVEFRQQILTVIGVKMKVGKEPFNQRVWTAFSRLIEKRYHRNIGFSPAMSVDYLGKQEIITKSGDLVVPLFAGEHFLGAIRVKKGGSLTEVEITAIREMFQKVGAALLDASNSLNEADAEVERKDGPKHLINIVGGGFESRHRLATDIHETLQSWSLVPWTDAGIAHWNTDDMEDLSNISLYVRDIFELSPKERQQLLALARLPESLRPHIVVGSYRPLMDYVEEQAVEGELANLFSKSSVFVDQVPKEYLRLKEVLEMLFGRDGVTPIGDQVLI
jgi:hypothetical protein